MASHSALTKLGYHMPHQPELCQHPSSVQCELFKGLKIVSLKIWQIYHPWCLFFWPPCDMWKFPSQGLNLRCSLQPKPQLQQGWILNPLCRPGDRTATTTETSGIINPPHHSGTSQCSLFKNSHYIISLNPHHLPVNYCHLL